MCNLNVTNSFWTSREVNMKQSFTTLTGIVTAAACSMVLCGKARALDIYVSPTGNDTWSGLKRDHHGNGDQGPFATIERARDEIRRLRTSGRLKHETVHVKIATGRYELKQPIELAKQDSGDDNAPVIYEAETSKVTEVRVVGGRALTGFTPVTDPAVLQRLAPEAREHVLKTDLKSQEIGDIPGIQTSSQWAVSEVGMELFFKDKPMTIARWPNKGFVKIVDVPSTNPVDIRGTKGDNSGQFTYEGDRPERWGAEKEMWLHGYWFWDWADQRQKVQSIDTAKHQIQLAPPLHSYGYRKGQWYYAFNILAELDEPGEYYVDRDAGVLYFWPPEPIRKNDAVISMLTNLVNMKDVSNVTWKGITFEDVRSTAISATGGENVAFRGCTVRNGGSWAIRISAAPGSIISGCDIYQMGDGGITLSGGDRKTLTPARMLADNNHIHHYSRWNPVYKPAVMIDGVGIKVSHNLIHDAPHMAIGFGGNDHVIEYNEIYNVCYESNDAGAMYAGRNWTMRGTTIRYNYLHDISGFQNKGCVGVYLDDQFSGTQIFGNIFNKVTRAAMIGGGRDCSIENNVFIDCVPAAHVDARGLGWAADGFQGLKDSLADMPYDKAPWSDRYPKLVSILSENPMAPRGNLIARNIVVGGRWGDFEDKAKPMVTFENNLLEQDPQFVNAAKGDFRLKPSSPAWKLGFKALPLDKIGLYKGPDRRVTDKEE